MYIKRYHSVILGILLVSLNSCDMQRVFTKRAMNEQDNNGIALHSQWILESFQDASYTSIAKSTYINIADDLKKFTGMGGCNSITGNLVVKKKTIQFKQIVSTKMACENLRQEYLFLKNLELADNYKIAGAQLFLYRGSDLLMTLESYR